MRGKGGREVAWGGKKKNCERMYLKKGCTLFWTAFSIYQLDNDFKKDGFEERKPEICQ